MVDRKTNVIMSFIKKDTVLQSIVGTKDELHVGNTLPPIIRLQELSSEEIDKINNIQKSQNMCFAIVQTFSQGYNAFGEQFLVPFDFQIDKFDYLYEAITNKLE
jgi:hypothetical protein